MYLFLHTEKFAFCEVVRGVGRDGRGVSRRHFVLAFVYQMGLENPAQNGAGRGEESGHSTHRVLLLSLSLCISHFQQCPSPLGLTSGH